jgi:hypothetical protein
LNVERNRALSRFVARFLIPLAIVGLVLLFFNRMAFSNLILARGDTYLYFYPYWQAAADALRNGRIPLWNPDIFMGAPFLANSQAGFLYPLNWLPWWLLPTPYAVSASILIHLVIAGWGTFLTGRRALNLGHWAALLAAALFALGGYLTAQVEHINQLQGLAWLPWYFVGLLPLVSDRENDLNRRLTVRAMLIFGLLASLQLLAGHTQTVFISGVAVAIWLLAWLFQSRPRVRAGQRMAFVLVGGGILTFLLAAAQLLPTLELTRLSSREGGLPLNEVLSFSWPPLHLARALLPAYDRPLFSEYIAFLPLTGLVLAVIGAWPWRRNRALLPWIVLIAVSLVMALGRFTPVYYLLGNLPGFDLFRVPARWLAPAMLGIALLAGYGWQRFWEYATNSWETDDDRLVASRALRQAIGFGFAAVTLLILWGFVAGWLAGLIPTGPEAPFEFPKTFNLLGWLIELALLSLLMWIILTQETNRARLAVIDLLILAIAVLWLGSRSLPYNQLTTPQAYFDLRSPPARLQVAATCAMTDKPCQSPPDRFLSLSDIFFDLGDQAEIDSIYAGQLDDAARYDYTIAAKHKEVVSPNLSMIFGLPAVDGFDGGILPLGRYAEMARLILPEGSATTDGRLREYLETVPDTRWLNLFNSRFVITDKVGDVWREGVFFDRQFPVHLSGEPVPVGVVPNFEATDLWLLSDGMPPPIEFTSTDGRTWLLTAAQLAEPDLYRYIFPEPASGTQVRLLPCRTEDGGCSANALTLVDNRDGTFLSLVPGPYRLVYSGDVKIYENLEVLPRAVLLYDWQWRGDTGASVDAMAAPGFDPGRSAVLVGDGPAPDSTGNGTADIRHYAPERVVVHVESDQAGLLLLTDAYYPGWRATVDGEIVPIYQADALFRGVFVPAGQHEVVFRFQPNSFRAGVVISLVGIGLMGVLVVWLWRSKQNLA